MHWLAYIFIFVDKWPIIKFVSDFRQVGGFLQVSSFVHQ